MARETFKSQLGPAWMVWLGWLEGCPELQNMPQGYRKQTLVLFLVRAHAQVTDLIPTQLG